MKQFTRLYNSLGMLAMLCLASCASDELNDRLLPAGKYPMTFATAMEGLTQTRATTDNTWAGDEKIAVQVGSEVKQYIPTSGNSSTLIGADAANTFYWQKADETKLVSAWYCGDGSTATGQTKASQLPTRWTIKTDQSGNGYAMSDLLYALPQDIAYSDRDKQLTFKHLPAKVVINLTKGKGLTEENIQNATVSILSQAITSGDINKITGIMAQTSAPDKKTIITNNVPSAPELGFQKSVQAIVVPQKVGIDTKFIKVTIGEGTDAARDYYYTTESADDANFECGKQYTYNITVTKGEELVVTDKTTVTWKDGTVTSGSVTEAKSFYVTCPSRDVKDFSISNRTEQKGDKYTVNSKSITISYKPYSISHRYYLKQGIAKVSTSMRDDETITLTVSDIRGDLIFAFEERVEVGDYYYSDGTWSNQLYKKKTCIGIVFKTGVGNGDSADNYERISTIHGYVAALTNANSGKQLAWSTENTATGVSTSLENFDGYSNTQIITKIPDYKSKYLAAWSCINNNGIVAPASSSGWYLPSCTQIRTLHVVGSSISTNFKAAGGNVLPTGDYWTSNEDPNNRTKVWHYSTYYPGFYNDHAKTESDRDFVRAMLTF